MLRVIPLALLCTLPAYGATPRPPSKVLRAPQRLVPLTATSEAQRPNASQARPLRAKTRAKKVARKKGPPRCTGVGRPAGRAPFSPGEELSYDISIAGLHVGRLETRVGAPRTVDGQTVLPLFGRGRANTVISGIKSFSGRYMALSDASSLLPVGVRMEGELGGDPRTEEIRFDPNRQHVRSDFLHRGQKGAREYRRQTAMFDPLSLLYYSRSVRLAPGEALCQEVFSARRLWRMEAEVRGFDTVDTPVGSKPVTVLALVFTRMPHKDFSKNYTPPRLEMDVFLSKDKTRAPLAFNIRTKNGSARAELRRWVVSGSERAGDEWQF